MSLLVNDTPYLINFTCHKYALQHNYFTSLVEAAPTIADLPKGENQSYTYGPTTSSPPLDSVVGAHASAFAFGEAGVGEWLLTVKSRGRQCLIYHQFVQHNSCSSVQHTDLRRNRLIEDSPIFTTLIARTADPSLQSTTESYHNGRLQRCRHNLHLG